MARFIPLLVILGIVALGLLALLFYIDYRNKKREYEIKKRFKGRY